MTDQLIILLAAAVGAVLLFNRLGLGSVLAYLFVGIVVGPFGANLVRDMQLISHLSELGVVMLLFVIGLELSRERLKSMRTSILLLGPTQVALSAILLSLLSLIWLPLGPSILVGMAFSLSSTALALQMLKERNLLSTPAGQSSFGILLFQDLAVIPMLAIIPFMGQGAGSTPFLQQLIAVAKALSVIGLVFFCGRYLLRPLLRHIAATGVKEAFTATALLLVISVAAAMHSVGLSMALGSFLAGILLAESEYRHELEVDIEPFKGLLLGLFFIAAGMMLDLSIVEANIGTVAGVAIGAMVLKTIVLMGIGRWRKLDLAQCATLGLGLGQVGEFGLVLFAAGRAANTIDASLQSIFGAVIILSMMMSPLLMKAWDKWLAPRIQSNAIGVEKRAPEPDDGHIIIAGVGRMGQIIGRVLNAQGFKTTVLEHDPSQIQLLQSFGYRVYYGDATRMDLLESAGAAHARLMIIAVDNPETTLAISHLVREKWPHLPLVVRARNRQTSFDLIDMGITDGVRETLSSSLDMAQLALRKLGVSAYRSYRMVEKFRIHDEDILQESARRRKDGPKALSSFVASAREQLEETMRADKSESDELADSNWG